MRGWSLFLPAIELESMDVEEKKGTSEGSKESPAINGEVEELKIEQKELASMGEQLQNENANLKEQLTQSQYFAEEAAALKTREIEDLRTQVSRLTGQLSDVTDLTNQVKVKTEEALDLSATVEELRTQNEKLKSQISLETYLHNKKSEEPSIIEAQLVECKVALAQARGAREQIALRYRELEKEFVRLKLELANSKQSEDDAQVLIEQYKRNTRTQLPSTSPATAATRTRRNSKNILLKIFSPKTKGKKKSQPAATTPTPTPPTPPPTPPPPPSPSPLPTTTL